MRSPKISNLFPLDDARRILEMMPNLQLHDGFIWAYTRDGNYAMKNGNWLLSQADSMLTIQQSSNTQTIEPKNCIWKVRTVPKIQLFLWRAISGALAVSPWLIGHGMRTNPLCQICHHRVETISYVLFECTIAWGSYWISWSRLLCQEHYAYDTVDIMEHLETPKLCFVHG